MTRFLKKLHLAFYFAVLLVYFSIAYPFLLFFSLNPKRHYNRITLLRKWISVLSMYTAGFMVKVKYIKPIDWNNGPYVLCPNHTSFLDINIINLICKQSFSYIGKIELLKNPVTRIFFKTIDITVDRNSKTSAFRAFKRGNELLREGKSIVIFPEGKIDDDFPPRLHSFKKGPFRMATDNGIPILPIVIHDAWKILWDDGLKYGSRPGVIHVTVLPPIPTSKSMSKDDLIELENTVYSNMEKIWAPSPNETKVGKKRNGGN